MAEAVVEASTVRIKAVAISEADSIAEAVEEAVEEITMTAVAVEEADTAVVVLAVAAAEVVVVAADSLLLDNSSTVRIDVGLHCRMKAEVDFLVDLEDWPLARYLTRTRAEVSERVVLQLEWEEEIMYNEEYTANRLIMARHRWHRPIIIKLSRRWEATCLGKCSFELNPNRGPPEQQKQPPQQQQRWMQ